MSVYCCARFIPPIYLYIWLSLPLVHIDTQPDQATLSIWILICFTCPIVNSPYPFPTWFQLQFCCFGKLHDISCICGAGPPLGHKLHICKIYGCIRKPVCQPIDQFRSDCEKWDSIFRFCFRIVFCSVVNDLSLFVPQLPVCNDCSFILILHRATTNAVVHINNRLRRDNKRWTIFAVLVTLEIGVATGTH